MPQYKTFILNSSFIFKNKTTGEDAFRLMVRESDSVYTDWFLPSKDEYNSMYTNLHLEGLGDFHTDEVYISSSEFSDTQAYGFDFSNGVSEGWEKDNQLYVRACRSFEGTEEDYPLQSIGPAGGLIFDHSDGLVYEAMQADQSTEKAFSNIDDQEIGTTGTAIGDGKTNTASIIAQIGHTDSAAKLCNDLETETTQNKLYIDRVLTPAGFDGIQDVDWEIVEIIESPAELDKLGKFVIGAKEIDGTDYFIWAELLTTLGIMGEAGTDYYLINIEN